MYKIGKRHLSDFEPCTGDMEEQNHRQTATTTRTTKHLLLALALLTLSIRLAECGCRMQDRNPCETVCQWNATRNDYECELRVIVILPKKDTVEASLPRVINDIHFVYSVICIAHTMYT